MNKQSVAIIGGGFAGSSLAQHLERLMGTDVNVTVVSRDNHLVFTPMLPEVAGRTISPLHISVPGRSTTKHTVWIEGDVLGVDLSERLVRYRTSEGVAGELRYDHVVLACGSESTLNSIPGLAAYGLTIKTVGEAVVLGNEVIERFEQASSAPPGGGADALLSAVVIGGGFSGVEIAGQINDLMKRLTPFYPSIEPGKPRVTVLQKGSRLLPELSHEQLSDFTFRKLTGNGIDVRLNTSAKEVTGNSVILESGERIPGRLVVCTIGTQTSKLIRDLGLPLEKGRVRTGDDMRVEGHDDAWAIGDCAVTRNAFDNRPTAPTAQFALREARQLAQNLERVMRGRKTQGFHFRPQGLLASIGNRNGVAEIYGLRFSGIFAWFLWRSVYLMKIPTLATKVGVALDWTTSVFFPPPLARIRLNSGPRARRSHYAQGDPVPSPEGSAGGANFIENGEVGVYGGERPAEGEPALATLKKGDSFGSALMHEPSQPASLKALTPLDLIELDERSFADLAESFRPAKELVERSRKVGRFLSELLRRQNSDARFRDLKVQEFLREAKTLSGDCTAEDALDRFEDQAGFWVVTGEGMLSGYLGRLDLYGAFANGGGQKKLSEIVCKLEEPLRADQNLFPATLSLLRSGFDTLPVVDGNGRVLGVYDPCHVLRNAGQGDRLRP
jgi:NADH dehydrogenase